MRFEPERRADRIGFRVVAAVRNLDALDDLAAENADRLLVVACDVTDPAATEAAKAEDSVDVANRLIGNLAEQRTVFRPAPVRAGEVRRDCGLSAVTRYP